LTDRWLVVDDQYACPVRVRTSSLPLMPESALNMRSKVPRSGSCNLAKMAQYLVERRLMEVSKRLRRVREELAVADEQWGALRDAAEEARLRSLVSETPLAAKEAQEAQRHSEAMRSARDNLEVQVKRLESELDELLDRLLPTSDG
jgi:chromosome segregation ATPase